MKNVLLMTIAGAAAMMAVGAAPVAARDNVAVSFDAGSVAFAYNDGYWDNDHKWHKWHNAAESKSFRESHKEAYHAWKHDRDADKGWHER